MTWADDQQRTHNLASFNRMPRVWFPVARLRGKTYKFEAWQIELAQRVRAGETRSN